jgi:hypothetical protein
MKRKLWSQHALAKELGHNERTIARVLENVPADGAIPGGHRGWHLKTALAALSDYSAGSSQLRTSADVHPSGTPVAIDRAASAVQDLLDQLRAETSVEARRVLLRAEGRCVGELHRLLEADLEGRGPEYPKIYGPYFKEMFAHVTAETLQLCELRYAPDDGGGNEPN